jgi:cbb3-type cytochrome oxidase subunit 3
MKEMFASPVFGLLGLLFFFAFFCFVLIWVFRPGSKEKYEKDAKIPLKEKNDE